MLLVAACKHLVTQSAPFEELEVCCDYNITYQVLATQSKHESIKNMDAYQ